jgi:hypothetical protein
VGFRTTRSSLIRRRHRTRWIRLSAQADIGLALEPGTTPNNDIAISNKLYTYILAGNAVVASNTSGQSMAVADLNGAAVTYSAVPGLAR